MSKLDFARCWWVVDLLGTIVPRRRSQTQSEGVPNFTREVSGAPVGQASGVVESLNEVRCGGGRVAADRLRVLFDARPVNPGLTGIGRYAMNVLLALDCASGVEVSALISPAGARMLPGLRRVELLEVEHDKPGWSEFGLPDLLASRGIGVYHSPLFVLPSVRPCACIPTVHDVIPRSRPDLSPPEFCAFFEANVDRALRSATAVLTVSEFSRADIVRHFPEAAAKTKVVYQPVGRQFRRARNEEVRRRTERCGVDPGFVLYAGAIDRRKGLEVLLDAWQLLRKTGATPPLVVAGGPSGGGLDLGSEVTSRGLASTVRWVGRVSDEELVGLYSGAAAFVFPSLYEGFGLPVLEAMACGAPVVTTTSSSLPEVAGESAILVPPESPGELANAIRRLLSEPSLGRELVEKGARRAAQFTLEATAAALEPVYRAALEKPR